MRVQLLHFISYKSSKRKRIKLQSKSYSLLVFVYSESTLCRPLKSGACHKYFNFLFFTEAKSRVQLLHFFLYKNNKKEQIKRQSRNFSLSLLLSFPQKILFEFLYSSFQCSHYTDLSTEKNCEFIQSQISEMPHVNIEERHHQNIEDNVMLIEDETVVKECSMWMKKHPVSIFYGDFHVFQLLKLVFSIM